MQYRASTLVALTALLLPIAAACTKVQRDVSNAVSTAAAVDTLSNGVPVALAAKSAEWVSMWRKAVPGFTPDSLLRAGRRAATLGQGVQPLDQSLVADTDSSVLREVMGEVSPTGRYVLIADAYRALPDSCGAVNPGGGEADEAAVLIDYQRRTCDTFLFCGTPCTFDWAGWLDSTHFAVAGSESDEETTCYGFVRFYSIAENVVTTWHTRPAPLSVRGRYYEAGEARIMAKCRGWKAAHLPS